MELLETMRAEGGTVALLERHLDRLAHAAAHFGYPFDRERIRADVAAAAAGLSTAHRIRLTLDVDGRVDLSLTDMERVPAIRTVALVPWPESAGEITRYKTTDRRAYDPALDAARAAGTDDAVLIGGDGLVVESTRANVWIRRGSEVLTPPLLDRGLPGIMRGHLLDTLVGARTADLREADLHSADEVLLSNAVRGLFRVFIGSPPDQRL